MGGFRGVVGYHNCLTRSRSSVRTRAETFFGFIDIVDGEFMFILIMKPFLGYKYFL